VAISYFAAFAPRDVGSGSSAAATRKHRSRASRLVRLLADNDRIADISGGPSRAIDRDRGAPHDAAPPTPPYVRVAYTAVREVSLTRAK
jgi:hypothetical protein